MYKITDKLIDEFKKPIGEFAKNTNELLNILKNHDKIVSIGDEVTYTLLDNDIKPVLCVVDYKTHRGEYPEEKTNIIKSYGKKTINIINPSGEITDDLWHTIEIIFENIDTGPYKIEIEGEEDLASLVAIYLAPSDVTIIYGLPNKGVVIVKSNNENKSIVKKALDKM